MVKRWLSRLFLAFAIGASVLVVWLWFHLFSPWGYTPPPNLLPIAKEEKHRVFAYGTLRQPIVRWLIIGRLPHTQPATLPGYSKRGLDLEPQKGTQTSGDVFLVDAEELRRIDRYERLGVRYQRSRFHLSSGKSAWVYHRLQGD